MYVFRHLKKQMGIIGSTQKSIEAIQRYIDKYSEKKHEYTSNSENPADSINRIIKSIECEETNSEIQKIIKNL